METNLPKTNKVKTKFVNKWNENQITHQPKNQDLYDCVLYYTDISLCKTIIVGSIYV